MAFIGTKESFLRNKLYPLAQFNNRWAVINNESPYLIENTCKHRQAVIASEPTDYFGSITCPLHGWTYNQKGALIGEPATFFTEEKCLKTKSLFEHNGLLFSEDPQIDWNSIPMKNLWNLQNYVYHNSITMHCNYELNYFMEAVLDSYHIPYVHPGLSHFCDVKSYQQTTGKGFAFQTTNLFKPFVTNPSSKYTEFQTYIAQNYPDRWDVASIWLVLFPNLFIDYYPGSCMVYSVWPLGNTCKVMMDCYYEDDIAAFDSEFIKLQQACFAESQAEDDILSEKYQQGRTNLSDCYTHYMESQIDDYYAQSEYLQFMEIR